MKSRETNDFVDLKKRKAIIFFVLKRKKLTILSIKTQEIVVFGLKRNKLTNLSIKNARNGRFFRSKTQEIDDFVD